MLAHLPSRAKIRSMKKSLWAVCAAVFLLQAGLRAGVDPKNFDPTVKPQDDFYHYANGGWMKANPIPPAYAYWGVFNEVDEHNKAALHAILERAAAAANPGFIEKLVGDFYASGMDEAAINAAGLTPLQPEFAQIAALTDVSQLPAELGRLHLQGQHVGFYLSSEADPGDSTMTIAGVGQSGLSLPDRDYYIRDDDASKKLREQYTAHVAKMFELAGDAPDAATAEAAAVLKLETALALGSKNHADLRDPIANYHKLPVADLQKLTPNFNWLAFFDALGLANPGEVDVGQPGFLQAFDAQIAATSIDDWKTYLRWHLLSSAAPLLSAPFVNEDFEFAGRTLTGAQQLRERWKRVLTTVDGQVGEALGQLYVAECFPPESKARVLAMVDNIRAALRARLGTLDWMDEPTRAAALKKLDALNVKIGYPNKWIDYSTLAIDRGPYVRNVLRAREFIVRRDLAKIGHPVDRQEWGMTPPTVNAYYDSSLNEIVFPAGILQPPFFDPTAGDPENYGSIGAVIGHEMTHGYDDEGRQYDGAGNLHEWWSEQSAANFKGRAAAIIKQFNGYVVLDGLHVNGQVTQGENIADLGGVKLAYAALQMALAAKPAAPAGDFTPAQRFFLSFATIWRVNQRPESLRQQVLTNEHSPDNFRVNGPLSNLPEFWAAFAVPEGAPMRRPEADRVNIW
jgi:predicted metalloendopeptidase